MKLKLNCKLTDCTIKIVLMELRSENVRKNYFRNCDHCGGEFIANRSDQRFCCPNCRYRFNNDKRRNVSPHYGAIGKQLNKNLRILVDFLDTTEKNHITVNRDNLIRKGFDFDANTGHGRLENEKHFTRIFTLGVYEQESSVVIFIPQAA